MFSTDSIIPRIVLPNKCSFYFLCNSSPTCRGRRILAILCLKYYTSRYLPVYTFISQKAVRLHIFITWQLFHFTNFLYFISRKLLPSMRKQPCFFIRSLRNNLMDISRVAVNVIMFLDCSKIRRIPKSRCLIQVSCISPQIIIISQTFLIHTEDIMISHIESCQCHI